jgi:ribonuclease P protein component
MTSPDETVCAAESPGTSGAFSQKPQRLRTRPEFLAVQKGQRFHAGPFSLQGLHRSDRNGPRFGLTVTRQTGNSVERNRIRRRLREILRLRDAGAKPDFDYVIVARRAALALPFEQLAVELQQSISGLHAGKGRKSGPRDRRNPSGRTSSDRKDQASAP